MLRIGVGSHAFQGSRGFVASCHVCFLCCLKIVEGLRNFGIDSLVADVECFQPMLELTCFD